PPRCVACERSFGGFTRRARRARGASPAGRPARWALPRSGPPHLTGFHALPRPAHAPLAAQVARGLAVHFAQRLTARPGVEQPPALLARAGAEVHDVVGGTH